MPKNISKKTYLVPDPKARLRQGTFEKPRETLDLPFLGVLIFFGLF